MLKKILKPKKPLTPEDKEALEVLRLLGNKRPQPQAKGDGNNGE